MKPRKKRESAAFALVDVHVGKRIKILRKLRGMNQTKLGEAVGLSFQQIQKYETGANRIGASRLFEFSQVFDVPVSCFFDDMPPELGNHNSTETPERDVFRSPDAAEVARIYYSIPDKSVRHSFRNLVKAMVAKG
jgi:transcriptional regulator with XRE-family HTH domain